jgi:hypothetical protein
MFDTRAYDMHRKMFAIAAAHAQAANEAAFAYQEQLSINAAAAAGRASLSAQLVEYLTTISGLLPTVATNPVALAEVESHVLAAQALAQQLAV